MTCPVCQFSGDPAASAGGVSVCAGCGASCCEDILSDLAMVGFGIVGAAIFPTWRRATAAETTKLSADDLATLRKARGLARRKA